MKFSEALVALVFLTLSKGYFSSGLQCCAESIDFIANLPRLCIIKNAINLPSSNRYRTRKKKEERKQNTIEREKNLVLANGSTKNGLHLVVLLPSAKKMSYLELL